MIDYKKHDICSTHARPCPSRNTKRRHHEHSFRVILSAAFRVTLSAAKDLHRSPPHTNPPRRANRITFPSWGRGTVLCTMDEANYLPLLGKWDRALHGG